MYVDNRCVDINLSLYLVRSTTLSKGLNKLEGVFCNEIEGAMYAFPTVTVTMRLPLFSVYLSVNLLAEWWLVYVNEDFIKF